MHIANPTQSRRSFAIDAIGQTLSGKLFFAVAASAFVGLCAHVSLPLFFTPVPLTLSNMAVVLVGLALGPSTAFAAMVLYLAEGALGLPVFTPSGGPQGVLHLIGPSAGYLFSYPVAAAVAGAAVRALKPVTSRFAAAAIAGTLATTIVLAAGATWLAMLLHVNLFAALQLGVTPFLAGEALKIAGAAGIYSGLNRWKRA